MAAPLRSPIGAARCSTPPRAASAPQPRPRACALRHAAPPAGLEDTGTWGAAGGSGAAELAGGAPHARRAGRDARQKHALHTRTLQALGRHAHSSGAIKVCAGLATLALLGEQQRCSRLCARSIGCRWQGLEVCLSGESSECCPRGRAAPREALLQLEPVRPSCSWGTSRCTLLVHSCQLAVVGALTQPNLLGLKMRGRGAAEAFSCWSSPYKQLT